MKTCRACQVSFETSQEEQRFLEHISPVFGGKKMFIPEPTLCPRCRNQRRMSWRNDRSFYHRKCDLSGKQFISIYPANSPYTVYQQAEWYGDRWNPLDYGRGYDFNRGFFEQFHDLMLEVPRLGIDIVNCENSDYCNYCGDDKNCYLDIAGEANEDCYFNLFVKYSKNVVDCTFVYNSQLCYECINCYDCYNVRHSIYCDNCSDCFFCFDLKGCKDCLFSFGLRNQQYCILNQQYSKEEYEQKLSELQLGSYSAVEQYKQKWMDMMKGATHRDMWNLNCENSTGNNLKNCKNTAFSFNASNCEDCRYLYDVLDAKDCQDLNYSLYKPEQSYELISTLSMVKCGFSMASHYNNEIYYCDLVNNSKNLFGCIGLNHQQYCILNKQYTKEEYEELVPRIIEHMKNAPYPLTPRHLDKLGAQGSGSATAEWGEFFPVEYSPFGYNETVAQEYYPLEEAEVEQRNWKWVDTEEMSGYQGPDYQLPDHVVESGRDDVLGKVLLCEKSGKPYKIIEQEYRFYQKLGIPLPRVCPDQRHLDRIALRNPRSMWPVSCTSCSRDTLSSSEPGKWKKLLCEECYLKDVK